MSETILDSVFSINIRGQDWTVRVIDAEVFSARYDESTAAFTVSSTKEIVFSADELNLSTVIHELTHAYFSASHITSANLSPDQVEEVMCEVIGEFGPEIIRVGRKLLKSLKTIAKEI